MMSAAPIQDRLNSPPRLLPDRTFPPYTYIPGSETPHPIRDSRGHSYARNEPACDISNPDNWRDCEPYVWGVDLFNAGYYWEAHEAWETAWIAAGRKGPTADFLKALIKLAAAGVKLRERNPIGARRHLRRAVELLDAVAASSKVGIRRMFGLAVAALRDHAARLLLLDLQSDVAADERAMPVLGVWLQPENKSSPAAVEQPGC